MVRLAYIGINKLNTFITSQKDKLPSQLHSNIIYKINCDASKLWCILWDETVIEGTY